MQRGPAEQMEERAPPVLQVQTALMAVLPDLLERMAQPEAQGQVVQTV